LKTEELKKITSPNESLKKNIEINPIEIRLDSPN